MPSSEHILASLRQAFNGAVSSPYSAFYRDSFAMKTPAGAGFPATLADWESLPFLTKERIVQTPFADRLFVPFAEAHSIRMSSGTSGRGIVLIPRNFHVDRTYYRGKFTKLLCFYIPHFGMDEACEPLGLGHLGAIPDDLPATARMASLFGIDGIAGAVSPILAFTKLLAPAYDCTRIRYIHLWGERPSTIQFAELEAHFPHAEFTWEYSNIEASGQSGRPCADLARLRDDRVHPLSDRYYWELIDPDTGSVIRDVDTEGEIVLTTLWDGNAFPAIRYRTGDLARRVAATCSCQNETYQILGRVAFDRAVIPGGELKSEELERVLEPFSHDIESDFELHIAEVPGKPPILTLYVQPRRRGVPLGRIREHVSAHMRIGATRTLADSERSGQITPLIVDELVPSGKKVRRIVKK